MVNYQFPHVANSTFNLEMKFEYCTLLIHIDTYIHFDTLTNIALKGINAKGGKIQQHNQI